MSRRLKIGLLLLAILVLANVGWRIWAHWGLVTIDADNAPLAQVVRSIGKQGGVQLVSNAGPDATVTMHVHKVPLVRALQVLAINTGGTWSAGYVLAPEKVAIRAMLDEFASGKEVAGWKRFALQMGGMPGMGGASDPREDRWNVIPPPDGQLQSYLEQGSQAVNAQFWVPAEWNPAVAKAPGGGHPAEVAKNLAAAGHGQSEEVFLLSVPTQSPPPSGVASEAPRPASDGALGGGPPGGPPSEAMQQAIAAREEARIAKLPADKRAAAQAAFDERRKFFDSLAQLSPEERQAKIRDRIEADMNSAGPSPFETRMTQFDAMHTAEQRANFFRRVIQNKQQAAGR